MRQPCGSHLSLLVHVVVDVVVVVACYTTNMWGYIDGSVEREREREMDGWISFETNRASMWLLLISYVWDGGYLVVQIIYFFISVTDLPLESCYMPLQPWYWGWELTYTNLHTLNRGKVGLDPFFYTYKMYIKGLYFPYLTTKKKACFKLSCRSSRSWNSHGRSPAFWNGFFFTSS